MSARWERRRILVWGKTRPEVSKNYRETVCTGGIFGDTGGLVRLYPVPLRYLDDERLFKKYQWITADVRRADDHDNRPESYRIRADGIEVGETIGTGTHGDWRERAGWVLRPANMVRSVEALQAQQAIDHTSLAVLKPKRIVQITAEILSPKERQEMWTRYKSITAQLSLPVDDDVRTPKPLTPPDYRFRVRFTCDDPDCRLVHKFGILDWEVDALYFSLKRRHKELAAREKVVDHLKKHLLADDREPRFFLGNISTHPREFTIVGLWYPKKPAPGLFDESGPPILGSNESRGLCAERTLSDASSDDGRCRCGVSN